MILMPLLEKCIVFNFSMSIEVTYIPRHSKEPIFVDLVIKENVYPSTLDVHKKKKIIDDLHTFSLYFPFYGNYCRLLSLKYSDLIQNIMWLKDNIDMK